MHLNISHTKYTILMINGVHIAHLYAGEETDAASLLARTKPLHQASSSWPS